jgi:hypothetical protein
MYCSDANWNGRCFAFMQNIINRFFRNLKTVFKTTQNHVNDIQIRVDRLSATWYNSCIILIIGKILLKQKG